VNRFDRRTFVTGALAGAGSLALFGPEGAADAARKRVHRRAVPLARDGAFRQGVAAGQPGRTGVTLWTRLEELDRRSRLQVEVATDEDFRRVVARRNVVADPSEGYTINARITKGLRPGEQYFYRFYTCNENSPVGRFRTARPADSQEPVRIGFFSCQDYQAGFYTAQAGLAREDVDLIVCLGDYIYERSFYDGPAERKDTTGANRDAEVQTLAEYRDKYNLYHSDANLRAMRASAALLPVWDDHEVEDNWAADMPGEATGQVRVPFPERRSNAFKAFFENMPRIPMRGAASQIYGRVNLGANAELFLLDTRQYRSDQACGDQFGVQCAETADPNRTLLGAAQKAWLKDRLARSQAAWKVIGTQVMIMALELPRQNGLNPDQWDGYSAERRELLEHLRTQGIDDVAFITGDIHTFWAGNVTPTGRQDEAGANPPAVATEFVGGAITSQGIADQFGEQGAIATAPLGDETIYANNPHIRFSDQQYKGYGVLTAERDELRVDYRAARSVASAQSEVFTLQRFRVRRGVPSVEVLDPPAAGAQPVPLPGIDLPV
jgi:alkaline phosphatase D